MAVELKYQRTDTYTEIYQEGLEVLSVQCPCPAASIQCTDEDVDATSTSSNSLASLRQEHTLLMYEMRVLASQPPASLAFIKQALT